MKYTYVIKSDSKIIVVKTTGDLVTKEVAAMGLKILLKAKELKYAIIFDYRLSKNRISIAEAYRWFSVHYDNIDWNLRYIRTAYLVEKEDWDFYSFFECTCYNKGIPVRAFLDKKAVLNWLKSY